MPRRLSGLLYGAVIVAAFSGIAAAEDPSPVTFVSWNLRNYLLDDHFQGGRKKFAAKSPEAIDACVRMLAGLKPDVLGVCEIGHEEDLADLKKRLKGEGIDLPHVEFVASSKDGVRHLALLSRFPIAQRRSPLRLSYKIGDEPIPFRRGILDVTITVSDDYQLRFMGLHLKSKYQAPGDPDEQLMRRNEAALARARVEEILATSPRENLLVYGDFNDEPLSTTLRVLRGERGTADYLSWLNLEAADGTAWTYHWDQNDAYSRFDYVLVSRWLSLEVQRKDSFLGSGVDRVLASDHRPLVVKIVPKEEMRPGE